MEKMILQEKVSIPKTSKGLRMVQAPCQKRKVQITDQVRKSVFSIDEENANLEKIAGIHTQQMVPMLIRNKQFVDTINVVIVALVINAGSCIPIKPTN